MFHIRATSQESHTFNEEVQCSVICIWSLWEENPGKPFKFQADSICYHLLYSSPYLLTLKEEIKEIYPGFPLAWGVKDRILSKYKDQKGQRKEWFPSKTSTPVLISSGFSFSSSTLNDQVKVSFSRENLENLLDMDHYLCKAGMGSIYDTLCGLLSSGNTGERLCLWVQNSFEMCEQ